MTETRARYDVTIERDDDGLPTRLFYSPSTPMYPEVAVDSHDAPVSCLLCGAVIVMHDDFDVCGACGSRRVRSQPKAAASRNASLIGYVDDLLDLLQDVGGMSAAWCETKLQEYEALLKGQ